MGKELLKKAKGWDGDPSVIDTHREVPKAEGGTYQADNYRVIDPVEHMKVHGNWRERPEEVEGLKILVDDREQIMKSLYQANNRLLAYKRRTDKASEQTQVHLEQIVVMHEELLALHTKAVEKWVKEHKGDRLIAVMLTIPSCGAQTIAYCLAYLEPEKANSASSFWKYAGLHCASRDRYEKGVASGGNKRLRTALYRMAESMMKNRACPYRDVYDRTKLRLSVSEKVTTTNLTDGKKAEKAWKDVAPGHRHGAALRQIMKHFLADLWFVWRDIEDLPTRPLYADEKLGHTGIVQPIDRGWVW